MPMKNPPHPGSFIRMEIIEPAGLTVTAAAAALRVSRPALSSLLNNKADLSGTSHMDYAQPRRAVAALLPIWLGFFAGTVLGAIGYIALGLPCMVLAILPVGGLALWFFSLSRAAR